MHKKFEINQTKINGGCQSGRKVVTHNSKRIFEMVETKFILTWYHTSEYKTQYNMVLNPA